MEPFGYSNNVKTMFDNEENMILNMMRLREDFLMILDLVISIKI